jgi:hypothetical protein
MLGVLKQKPFLPPAPVNDFKMTMPRRASIIQCAVDCSGFRCPHDLETEIRVTFLLSGGDGAAVLRRDDGSAADLRTAHEHLVQRFGPLRIGIELDRYRSAARSLVTASTSRTAFG